MQFQFAIIVHSTHCERKDIAIVTKDKSKLTKIIEKHFPFSNFRRVLAEYKSNENGINRKEEKKETRKNHQLKMPTDRIISVVNKI